MKVLAIFGPTAVGKTGVAIAVAELLRERGEDPVAISCDAIQVYRGLEVLSGAASPAQRARLEHRLLSFIPVEEEFSAGRFAALAHEQIDSLLAEGRRPIVVGGTGLYLRAALSELDLRPPVPAEVRREVEREIAERGPEELHRELDPVIAATVEPADRKRIARWTELLRAGIEPPALGSALWTAELRQPTLLIGLTVGHDRLDPKIAVRVKAIITSGAAEEVRRAVAAGASRTARAALGFEELLNGDVEAMTIAHRRYARRQLTWMRRMKGVRLIDRTDDSDFEVADRIVGRID